MAEYLTTREVAKYLHLNEKKVYALVAEGRLPAARICGKWLFERELIDRWVRECTVFPSAGLLGSLLDQVLIVQGSDDFLLERAIEAARPEAPMSVASSRVGSITGIGAVCSGRAHLAGFHLDDVALKKCLSPQTPCYLVQICRRQQGLVLADQHKDIRTMTEVVDRHLRFAVRQESSGTFQLTQHLLQEIGAGFGSLDLVGPFHSHLEVALAVRTGRAEAGLSIQVAAELCSLHFAKLREESFRLAIPTGFFGHPNLARFIDRLLDWLKQPAQRETPGYSFGSLGALTLLGVR